MTVIPAQAGIQNCRHSRAGGNPARGKTALHHQVRKPPRASFFATALPESLDSRLRGNDGEGRGNDGVGLSRL